MNPISKRNDLDLWRKYRVQAPDCLAGWPVATLLSGGAGNVAPWEEIRDELNSMLRGWFAYFSYGNNRPAKRCLGYYVYERIRDFLARRHKVRGRGIHTFSYERVYGELGVIRADRLLRPTVLAVGHM